MARSPWPGLLMKLGGWGRYPVIDAVVRRPDRRERVYETIERADGLQVPFGMGRSYGDCALQDNVLDLRGLDRYISFDPASGQLVCEAGLSLDQIIQTFLPRGWFPAVTPGTRYVTVGGAIAADVHGKNHHVDGSFSEFVDWIELLLPDGTVKRCSRTRNKKLFQATCGGMGLTGVILAAAMRLRAVTSGWIRQRNVAFPDLPAALAGLDAFSDWTYSVAWIDMLASGDRLGRSILMLGEHCDDGDLVPPFPQRPALPVDLPQFVLNRWTVKAFNTLYYAAGARNQTSRVPCGRFFHPLDAIPAWNRLYGARGFVQYQLVVPDDVAEDALRDVMQAAAAGSTPSFLAVLKRFGPANDNWLSFPTAGVTLTIDLPVNDGLFPLLERLDAIVADAGGRLYLAKDARMGAGFFHASYPGAGKFSRLRAEIGADKVFASKQSERLEL